jgi:metal-responsive CopG/Arc/MetJ family transcriptional regulator
MKKGTMDYGCVCVPRVLLAEIDQSIKKHPRLGISSRSEAVKIAIRAWIERVNQEPEDQG